MGKDINNKINEELREENERLKKLCREVGYIMSFHSMRCPMDIPNNYSGMEEHLDAYRRLQKELSEV